MTMRATILLVTVLGSLALTSALGAVLTEDKPQGPLSLGDVLIPAAIPVLLVIAVTMLCRRQLAHRERGDQEHS
jgi:hypothetical protein